MFQTFTIFCLRNKVDKKLFIDNISLKSIQLNIFSSNLTLQISDYFPQFLVAKDFYYKNLINSNNFFEQNYRIFNDDENKNDFDIE